MDMAIDTISGTAAGIAQVVVGHPLDTLKIRMQASSVLRSKQVENTRTVYSTLRTTIQRDGFLGLYKGAAAPLCGAMLQNASAFLFWGISKRLFQKKDTDPATGKLTIPGLFKSGLVVGMLCLMIEHPIDLLKTQMQVQVGAKGQQYSSVFDVARSIYTQKGVVGFYQGIGPNFWRFVPGRAVYLSSFEVTNRWLQKNKRKTSTISELSQTTSYVRCFIAGGVAGGMAWISTYPFDVIRNTMMGDAINSNQRKFQSMWHCSQTIWKHDGWQGFWRGLTPCLLRGIPVNGCIFVVYTKIAEELSERLEGT